MASGGVQYYKVDTNRYDDVRIVLLKDNYGAIGLAIYDYILCAIYGGEGYYIQDNEELSLRISQALTVKIKTVKEVISYTCAVGLFNKELRIRENILTSSSIQKRWLKLVKHGKRNLPSINEKYCVQHPANVVQHPANVVQHPANVVQHPANVVQHPANVVQHPGVTGENDKEKAPLNPKIEKEKEENSYNSACITFVGDSEPELFEEGEKPQPKHPETPAVKEETAAEKKARLVALCEKREQEFYDSLVPYVEVYGKEMIRAFFDYWTEPNKSGTQMRFELERTWCLSRRLGTWAKNNAKYERSSTSRPAASTATGDPSRDSYAGISELIRKRIV